MLAAVHEPWLQYSTKKLACPVAIYLPLRQTAATCCKLCNIFCTHAYPGCVAFRWQSICAAALQAFELRLWPHQHPLRQFDTLLSHELLWKLEERHLTMDRLQVCSFCLSQSVLGNGCKSIADSLWVLFLGLLRYMCTTVAQLSQVSRLGSMSDSMQVHSAARHLMAMKLYFCTVEVCEAPALRQHPATNLSHRHMS